jgi:hypothetical protein
MLCHYAECLVLFIAMLNVIMLSVVMPSVVEPIYLAVFSSLIPGFINKDITVWLDGVRPPTINPNYEFGKVIMRL